MSFDRRWSSSFISSFWLVLIAVIWATFAPTQIGGLASFVLISGTSMEPNFHSSDLVIVHKELNYEIGDIIVYRNLDLGNDVFHRIIGQKRDRYIMKGDNNSWIDSYHPLNQDVIGKLWVFLPGAGKWIQTIRQPINMASIAGALAGLLAISVSRERAKGKKTMKKTSIRDWIAKLNPIRVLKDRKSKSKEDPRNIPGSSPKQNAPVGGSIEAIFFVLGLIAFASLMIGLIAFTRPATRSVPEDVNFQHLGFFTYSAPTPIGVYDPGGLKNGQPIFPKITCSINLDFQYILVGNQPKDTIAGSYQLLALVTEPISGWQRTIPIVPETPFTGNTFNANTSFNVCQVETMIGDMEGQTDFHPGSYKLSIEPTVRVTGLLSGHQLDDTFQPQLTFGYDHTHFFIIQDDPKVDPLKPSQAGLIRNFRTEANSLSILGLDASVPALRVASVVFLLLSIFGLIGFGKYLQNMANRDPLMLIRAKYASILVETQNGDSMHSSHIMEVATIDDLAKLAERNNAVMLHEARGQSHYFFVDGNGTAYQYTYHEPGDPFQLDQHHEDEEVNPEDQK